MGVQAHGVVSESEAGLILGSDMALMRNGPFANFSGTKGAGNKEKLCCLTGMSGQVSRITSSYALIQKMSF